MSDGGIVDACGFSKYQVSNLISKQIPGIVKLSNSNMSCP